MVEIYDNISTNFNYNIHLVLFYTAKAQDKTIEQKVDSILNLMTLEEKIGQLNTLCRKDESYWSDNNAR